jgi:hypothetical protein
MCILVCIGVCVLVCVGCLCADVRDFALSIVADGAHRETGLNSLTVLPDVRPLAQLVTL